MTADMKVVDNAPGEEFKIEVKEEKPEIDLNEKKVEINVKEEKGEIDLQEKEVGKNSNETATDENETAENEPLVKEEEEPVSKKIVHKQDYEEGMVYLYQTNRSPVLPSIDPSCLKLETWLRLSEAKYENVDHGLKLKSKKGQLPFIELDGEEYSDIPSIIKVLNVDIDRSLTLQQKSLTRLVIAMLENHFSWVLKSWRSENPEKMLKAYNMDLQSVTGKTWPNVILSFMHKRQIKKLALAVVAHGIGVHTPEEIESFGKDDLQVLSDLLAEQDYFFGDSPSSLDVVAFAHLSQLVYMDSNVQCELRDWLNENCTNLANLCDRLKAKAYPDWEELLRVKVKEPKNKEGAEEKEKVKESKKEKKSMEKKKIQDTNEMQKEDMNKEENHTEVGDKSNVEKEGDTNEVSDKVEENNVIDNDNIQDQDKKVDPSNQEEKKDEEKLVDDKQSVNSTEL